MEIVLATLNLHKIREFREMFRGVAGIECISLHSFLGYSPPEEVGETFQENAILKAEHAAKELKCLVLADDSGLVVPALQNEPGVFSRRYAGANASDAENRRKLLVKMEGLEGVDRAAYYVCALALAGPEGLKKCMESICEGVIGTEEKGRHGFGYDSLFIKHGYQKSFSELDETVKNQVSHRRKAFQRLLPFLVGKPCTTT